MYYTFDFSTFLQVVRFRLFDKNNLQFIFLYALINLLFLHNQTKPLKTKIMATFKFTLPIKIGLLALICIIGGCFIWKKCCVRPPKEDPCYSPTSVSKNQKICPKPLEIVYNVKRSGRDTINKSEKQVILKYACNQLIVAVDKSNAIYYNDTVVPTLTSKGYKKIKVCPCGEQFELWESENGDVNPIDVLPPPPASGGGKLGTVGIPNFYMAVNPSQLSAAETEGIMPKPMENCRGKNSVKIAILDTGVELESNDASDFLRQRPNGNWNFYNGNTDCCRKSRNQYGINMVLLSNIFGNEPDDRMGHGTAVNAVVAGRSIPNFGLDIEMKINNVSIFDTSSGSGTLFDAFCGMHYAIGQKPHIINMSWGIGFVINHPNDAVNYATGTMGQLFLNIFKENKNILFIGGAGNDSIEMGEFRFLPACLTGYGIDNLISVGSLNSTENELAAFSNFDIPGVGNMVDFYVVGDRIIAPSIPGNSGGSATYLKYMSGTSYSAPFVSRMASVLISKGLSPAEVKQRLKSNYCVDSFHCYKIDGNLGLIERSQIQKCLCDLEIK